MSADELRFAIVSGDSKTLSKAPGIGSKTAQRMIIDLKDKISFRDALNAEFSENEDSASGSASSDAQKEAAEALVALGYSQASALKAVRKAGAEAGDDVGKLLKLALKVIQ